MAPMVNRLFSNLEEDKKLANNVKMIAIAIGNNPDEVAAYGKNFQVKFPMVRDPDKAITHKVKVEGTPTLFLINKNGKVLFSHTGYLKDLDVLLTEIRKNVK